MEWDNGGEKAVDHTSGNRPSLQILISVLLIFLSSVYNRNILLIIPIILILD